MKKRIYAIRSLFTPTPKLKAKLNRILLEKFLVWGYRELAALIIRFSCIPFFIRNFYARNKVSIIIYHDPKPDILEKHLKYLSKRYNFITLDNLVNAIYTKNWEHIPTKGLIITLDDGHKGNFALLDIFKRYQVSPVIYICSQIVNTNRHFWFKTANIRSLMKCSNRKRLAALKKNYGFTNTKEYPGHERQALNIKELRLMKDFVDFQSHTRFHPILTTYEDEQEKYKEIYLSKKEIETLLNKDCKHFCYPGGDYTETEVELVKKAGYLSARTIDTGWNDLNTNPYKLKLTGVTDDASVNVLAVQLSGIPMYLRYLTRGSLNGKHPTIKLKK